MDILLFVGALASFIFVHELGHFLAARLFKMEVEEFGFGLPPRLFTMFTFKGTAYTINLLPLGGFVRIKGENDPDTINGFYSHNPWKRFTVLVAGPLMNIITAILLYSLAFQAVGRPDMSKVLITGIDAGTPAESAGLQAGDIFVSVNQQPIDSSQALTTVIQANKGVEISVVVERDGALVESSMTPRSEYPDNQGPMGVQISNPTIPISIFEAVPYGSVAVVDVGYNLLTLPVQVARGAIAPEDARLVGFKGMYDIQREVASIETAPGVPAIFNLLAFYAMINTSLGFLNLLPIPALDGGRILFLMPEILFRRRLPARLENTVNAVSFLVLLAVLIYVNLQDFINPVVLNP